MVSDCLTCQICGKDIEPGSAVYCTHCETPHHLDCWEYNKNTCSTYGCDGKTCTENPPERISEKNVSIAINGSGKGEIDGTELIPAPVNSLAPATNTSSSALAPLVFPVDTSTQTTITGGACLLGLASFAFIVGGGLNLVSIPLVKAFLIIALMAFSLSLYSKSYYILDTKKQLLLFNDRVFGINFTWARQIKDFTGVGVELEKRAYHKTIREYYRIVVACEDSTRYPVSKFSMNHKETCEKARELAAAVGVPYVKCLQGKGSMVSNTDLIGGEYLGVSAGMITDDEYPSASDSAIWFVATVVSLFATVLIF